MKNDNKDDSLQVLEALWERLRVGRFEQAGAVPGAERADGKGPTPGRSGGVAGVHFD